MKKFLIFFVLTFTLWAKPTYTIAIVTDGDTEYSKEFLQSLKTEIKQLLGRDYIVRFPKKLYKNGHWDYNKIASYVNAALKDKRSDMLITLGVLSSHYVARKKYFPKPVIATAIIDPKMQHVPYNPQEGSSGKHNLTYVSGHQTLDKDIEAILEIMPVHKVAVLIDSVLLKNTPEIGRYIVKTFAKNNIEAQLVPVGKHVEQDLRKIKDDVDFVYVTPLFELTKEQRKKLYSILSMKELPSFAGIGQDDVELGALFANSPSTDNKRFIRQIALDVQQIALGSYASTQLVNFTPAPVLSLNMKTANDIGYTPSWEMLSKANIIKSEQSDSHYFDIEEIMNRAVEYNLKIVASKHQTKLSKAKVDEAKSSFLPQVSFGAETAKVDEDRAVASLGLTNELRADAYIKFSQQLLNHKASARISINKNFLKAQNKATDFVKLDIGLAAAINYLRVLQLRTKLQIEKGNLELSKTNMRSAISRRNIGIGSTSDIYRWETQIAGEKKSLLFTHALLQQTKHSLNALLDLPQDLPLNFKSVDMTHKVFMTHEQKMRDYFLDQTKFAKFQAFLVDTAKLNMPSIAQYDAIEAAKKRIVSANEASFYLPTLAIQGGVKEHFISASNEFRDTNPDRFSDFPYADNTDWEIGIVLDFPLYLGGAKTAQLEASKAALLVAEAQRKDIINDVECKVRNALYQAKASYLSIKLAQSASKSSKKNLALIKSVYDQGNIGIIELLDAQNTALRAALIENNTRYNFMRDLLILQHHIGQVNFDLNTQDWDAWSTALDKYNVNDKE